MLGDDLPWEQFHPDELREYLRVYNVRWIIAWSPQSHEFLDARPELFELRRSFEGSRLRAYEYAAEPSFLIRGRGEVEADFDEIVVDGIVPEAGSIVLSLHWLPLFESDPPRELRRHPVLDDPVGFIEVLDPPERLVIRNRGLF